MMMKNVLAMLMVGLLAVFMVGCGGDDDDDSSAAATGTTTESLGTGGTTETEGDLTGTWVENGADEFLTINHSGDQLTGTWEEPSDGESGTLAGTTTGQAVEFVLTEEPGHTYTFTGTLDDARTSMTGTVLRQKTGEEDQQFERTYTKQ